MTPKAKATPETPATKPLKISAALRKIENDIQVASGYPTATVQDPAMAFAYGYVWALVATAAKYFEDQEKEHEHEQRHR